MQSTYDVISQFSSNDLLGSTSSSEWLHIFEEPVRWLHSSENNIDIPPIESRWCQHGVTVLTVDTVLCQSLFCRQSTLEKLLHAKTDLSRHTDRILRRARRKCGIFEAIGRGPFMNRAAMKMANLDARLNFILSNPLTQSGASAVCLNEPLFFGDLCGGPGGFSEYMLWRCGWRARGFCITLRDARVSAADAGSNDFQLQRMFAVPAANLDIHYGDGGCDGDGDITTDTNQLAFSEHVLRCTSSSGVHVVLADGGFDVSGREALQEILSRRLYLCQCLLALCILREGGHFVCKLFDVHSPFTCGLLYLLRRCFHSVAIIKPNTSRPANSERYLVCRWRLPRVDEVRSYLRYVNLQFASLSSADNDGGGRAVFNDVIEIVPRRVMTADYEFTNYLTDSINSLAERQTRALARLSNCCDVLRTCDKLPGQTCVHSSTSDGSRSGCEGNKLDVTSIDANTLEVNGRDGGVIDALQRFVRNICLQIWQLPAECRRHLFPYQRDPLAVLSQLACQCSIEELVQCVRSSEVKRLLQWSALCESSSIASMLNQSVTEDCGYFFPSSSVCSNCDTNICLLLGVYGGQVWRLAVNDDGGEWSRLQLSLSIPYGTLLLAELVTETYQYSDDRPHFAGSSVFAIEGASFDGYSAVKNTVYTNALPATQVMSTRTKTDATIPRVDIDSSNDRDYSDCRLSACSRALTSGTAVCRRTDSRRKHRRSVHVFDALFLAGEDVRHLPVGERRRLLSVFVRATAASTSSHQRAALLRVKPAFRLAQLDTFIKNMLDSHSGEYTVLHSDSVSVYSVLNSVIILNNRCKTDAGESVTEGGAEFPSLAGRSQWKPDMTADTSNKDYEGTSQSGTPKFANEPQYSDYINGACQTHSATDDVFSFWSAGVFLSCPTRGNLQRTSTRNERRRKHKRARMQGE